MKKELKVNFLSDHKFVSKETEKEIFDFVKDRIEIPEHLIGLIIEIKVDTPMVVTYTCYAKEKK